MGLKLERVPRRQAFHFASRRRSQCARPAFASLNFPPKFLSGVPSRHPTSICFAKEERRVHPTACMRVQILIKDVRRDGCLNIHRADEHVQRPRTFAACNAAQRIDLKFPRPIPASTITYQTAFVDDAAGCRFRKDVLMAATAHHAGVAAQRQKTRTWRTWVAAFAAS